MRTGRRTKVLAGAVGLLAGAVGLGLLLTDASHPVGTLLLVGGLGFGGTMLASLWIYRSDE